MVFEPMPSMFDVKRFGAKGDGRTNDTAALKSVPESVPKGGALVFPPTDTIEVKDSVIANNAMYHASLKELIRDHGGHDNLVLRDNPGSLQEEGDLEA